MEQEKLDYYSLINSVLASEFLRQTAWTMQFFFELAFTIDLIITLSNPLYPPRKRLKYYWRCFIIYVMVFFTWEHISMHSSISDFYNPRCDDCLKKAAKSVEDFYNENHRLWRIFLIFPMIVLVILGICSVIKAHKALKSEGIGMDIRNKVIRI